MSVLDFILNLAALLLWINWRMLGVEGRARATGGTLLGTLKRINPAPAQRWSHLLGLVVLLGLRSLLYGQLGGALNWVPQLPFVVVSIPFRSDLPWRMPLYSLGSFGLTLAVFYLWLLLLSLLNRCLPDTDPVQRLVRLHLGWLENWPQWIKPLLPLPLMAPLWFLLAKLLVHWQILPPAVSSGQTWQQGLVLGLASLLAWKYLILGILALRLVTSHVYLGHAPIWNYIDATARQILRPIGWLPLRLGRMDLAPLFGLGLAWLAFTFAARGLTMLYQKLPL